MTTTDLLPMPPELAIDEEPFSEADLTDHLARPEAETSTLPLARWTIEDDGAAEWALRHLAAAQSSLTEVRDQADIWRSQIDRWEDDQAGRHQGRIAFFVGHLEDFARRRRAENPRAKTLRLPSGEVRSTSHKEAPKIVDPEALAEWAREHAPDVVETTYRVPARALKDVAVIVEELEMCSAILACDHMVVSYEDVAEVGEVLTCPECTLADEEGSRPVVSVEVHTRRVVRHKGSEGPLPGVEVEPAYVSFAVAVTR